MIRVIISLLACLFVAVQIVLVYFQGDGICLNEGCKVVDSLTTVPPFYFNLAGLVFFLTLLFGFLKGLRDSEFWQKFTGLLLLAGIAAEGVLVYFQHSIVTVYCSYCLIIFSLIVVLNVLSGLRQCLYAGVIFTAVIVASVCLQFNVAGSVQSLDVGSVARISGAEKVDELYLFFSSSCPHCEEILAEMKENNRCSVRFNPVEKMDSFDFLGAEQFDSYDPEVNRNFLKNLSLDEIPVLVAKNSENIQIYVGERQIEKYLAENCHAPVGETLELSTGSSDGYDFLHPLGGQGDDKCSVNEDCADLPEEVPQAGVERANIQSTNTGKL
jgi:thiol-disulfide isomerase/thioredoxin